jgi:hypothetical protein
MKLYLLSIKKLFLSYYKCLLDQFYETLFRTKTFEINLHPHIFDEWPKTFQNFLKIIILIFG